MITNSVVRSNVIKGPEEYWLSWLLKAETDTRAWELVRRYQHRPPEELYDLREDPFELHNLATDANYTRVKDELRTRMESWMQEQNDPLAG